MKSIREFYNYREMLFNLVKKDLRTRYKGSLLGFLWTFINPLLQLLVYSVVFSVIMRVDVENYAIYLFVALIPWLFLASSLQSSCSCIINQKDLIKKVYFPRLIIPLSVVSSAFMNMLFSMVIVILALLISGIGISKYILYLPLIMILEYLVVVGLSFIFSALNVYFRDLEHILSIIIMLWFYFTPIVYTMDMIPEKWAYLFKLNPMTTIIQNYRDVLYYQQSPNLYVMLLNLVYGLILTIIGIKIFSYFQRRFAEEL